MRHALLVIGLVSTLASAEAVAEPTRVQADGVSFVAPSGWTADPKTKLYLAPDVPKDESCYIGIMPTVPLKGHSPEDVFTLFQEPSEVVSDTGVLTAKTKAGNVTLSQEKVVLHGRRLWRGYYSVVQDGHLAGLLLSATTEQLFTKSIAAAKALRESMQLAKPAKP
jgi:hypothetical protein